LLWVTGGLVTRDGDRNQSWRPHLLRVNVTDEGKYER